MAESGLLPASEKKPPDYEPLGVRALVDTLAELRNSASAAAVPRFASVSGAVVTEDPESDNSPRLDCAVQAPPTACANDGSVGSSCASTADADTRARKAARQIWASLAMVFVFVVLVMVVNPCGLLLIDQ